MSAVSRVTFYRDAQRKWRWRFARNGNVMADSGQGYSRRIDCVRAAETVLGGICDDPSQPTVMYRIHMQDRTQTSVVCAVLKRKPNPVFTAASAGLVLGGYATTTAPGAVTWTLP